MARLANGFYSFSDSYLKSMNKKDLINYIRTIEKNWENQLITNEIQYNNCKKLLAEERNKAIDEFVKEIEAEYDNDGCPNVTDYLDYKISIRDLHKIAEQLKEGAE